MFIDTSLSIPPLKSYTINLRRSLSLSLYFLDTPLVLYCYLSHTYTQLCQFNPNGKEGRNADQQNVDNNPSISLVNKTVNGFQYNDYTVYAGNIDQNFWVHVFLLLESHLIGYFYNHHFV